MDENEGLVYCLVLDGMGGGRKGSWKGVRDWDPGKEILWIHLDYASEAVQSWVSEESGIDPVVCEALLADETRPRALFVGDSLLVILRGVNCNPGEDPEDMVSLRMWIEGRRIISIRHRKVKAIEDVAASLAGGKGPKTAGEFLVDVAGLMAGRAAEVTGAIDESVDDLEDSVLTGESHELRSKLSRFRRQAIALRRYLAPQREVLGRLHADRTALLSEIDQARIREVADRTTRLVEDLDAARDRAAVVQEELAGKLAEQMNKTMYVLSIVAGIILPLSLLTGLLGINVGGMPGIENNLAFTIVCILLVALAGVQYWIFRLKHWL
jgi:zinc transporter